MAKRSRPGGWQRRQSGELRHHPRRQLSDALAIGPLTALRQKLVKVGARIMRHGRDIVFQLAEVAVPRTLPAAILRRIDRLRGPPPPAT